MKDVREKEKEQKKLNEYFHCRGVIVFVSRCRVGRSTGTLAHRTRRQGRRRRGGRTGARTTGRRWGHGRDCGGRTGAKRHLTC